MTSLPFPFDTLPKVTREDVAAQAKFRAVPTSEFASALAAVLQCDVAIRFLGGRAPEPVQGVAVGFADASSAPYLVEVERALAREVVARALKHETGIDAGKPIREDVAGAFAAVLQHVLRRVVATPLRPIDPGEVPPAAVVALAVDVAGMTYGARVTAPAPAHERTPAQLEFPVSLPLATSCLVSRAALEGLEAGDVFLPPALLGGAEFALIAPTSERGIGVVCSGLPTGLPTHAPRLVIRNNATMAADTTASLEVALDAPVVVRVELGAVEMKAREWAALGEGDVITLQRKLGEPAILRIAGQEVARGELVQVDGEYGIRIMSTNR